MGIEAQQLDLAFQRACLADRLRGTLRMHRQLRGRDAPVAVQHLVCEHEALEVVMPAQRVEAGLGVLQFLKLGDVRGHVLLNLLHARGARIHPVVGKLCRQRIHLVERGGVDHELLGPLAGQDGHPDLLLDPALAVGDPADRIEVVAINHDRHLLAFAVHHLHPDATSLQPLEGFRRVGELHGGHAGQLGRGDRGRGDVLVAPRHQRRLDRVEVRAGAADVVTAAIRQRDAEGRADALHVQIGQLLVGRVAVVTRVACGELVAPVVAVLGVPDQLQHGIPFRLGHIPAQLGEAAHLPAGLAQRLQRHRRAVIGPVGVRPQLVVRHRAKRVDGARGLSGADQRVRYRRGEALCRGRGRRQHDPDLARVLDILEVVGARHAQHRGHVGGPHRVGLQPVGLGESLEALGVLHPLRTGQGAADRPVDVQAPAGRGHHRARQAGLAAKALQVGQRLGLRLVFFGIGADVEIEEEGPSRQHVGMCADLKGTHLSGLGVFLARVPDARLVEAVDREENVASTLLLLNESCSCGDAVEDFVSVGCAVGIRDAERGCEGVIALLRPQSIQKLEGGHLYLPYAEARL